MCRKKIWCLECVNVWVIYILYIYYIYIQPMYSFTLFVACVVHSTGVSPRVNSRWVWCFGQLIYLNNCWHDVYTTPLRPVQQDSLLIESHGNHMVHSMYCSWPELKVLHTINAHPANCICIEFDPKGK